MSDTTAKAVAAREKELRKANTAKSKKPTPKKSE